MSKWAAMPKHKPRSKACMVKTLAAVTSWSTKPVLWSPALPVAVASVVAMAAAVTAVAVAAVAAMAAAVTAVAVKAVAAATAAVAAVTKKTFLQAFVSAVGK